jgi:hypothetical protein
VDEMVRFLENNLGLFFGTSVHNVNNVDVTFHGPNAANVTAYIDNPMFVVGFHLFSSSPTVYVRGYYHHEVVRTVDGVWKSKRLWEEIISAPIPSQLLLLIVQLAVECAVVVHLVTKYGPTSLTGKKQRDGALTRHADTRGDGGGGRRKKKA